MWEAFVCMEELPFKILYELVDIGEAFAFPDNQYAPTNKDDVIKIIIKNKLENFLLLPSFFILTSEESQCASVAK